MIGSGVFEFEIDGKTVGFEFGMLAAAYTEEKAGINILELFKQLGSGSGTTKYILTYFYGGAVAYAEFRELPDKITVAKVSKWLDHIGLEEAMKIYLKSIEAYLPKNGKAPKGAKLADV